MNEDVVDKEIWTKEDIYERTDKLVKIAMEIFDPLKNVKFFAGIYVKCAKSGRKPFLYYWKALFYMF